jgi:AcrR family transcriptional regulator
MSRQVRRNVLLEAASRRFAAAGYHGTSTYQIAQDASVSQPYVVRLFGSKEDLFLEALTLQVGLFCSRNGSSPLLADLMLQAVAVQQPGSIPAAARHAAQFLKNYSISTEPPEPPAPLINQMIADAIVARLEPKESDH